MAIPPLGYQNHVKPSASLGFYMILIPLCGMAVYSMAAYERLLYYHMKHPLSSYIRPLYKHLLHSNLHMRKATVCLRKSIIIQL